MLDGENKLFDNVNPISSWISLELLIEFEFCEDVHNMFHRIPFVGRIMLLLLDAF